MKIEYDDLPESVQEHIARLEVEMQDVLDELKLHRFIAVVVLGWMLERFVRWVF